MKTSVIWLVLSTHCAVVLGSPQRRGSHTKKKYESTSRITLIPYSRHEHVSSAHQTVVDFHCPLSCSGNVPCMRCYTGTCRHFLESRPFVSKATITEPLGSYETIQRVSLDHILVSLKRSVRLILILRGEFRAFGRFGSGWVSSKYKLQFRKEICCVVS